MIWTQSTNPADTSVGYAYYSASCIVWRQDKTPLCKYIVQRIVSGKGFRWMLFHWQPDCEQYVLVPFSEQQPAFARLFHAQDRAAWLERKDARAGLKPDHSSPIEAAAEKFAACFMEG